MNDAPLPSPAEYNEFLRGIEIHTIRMAKGSFESTVSRPPGSGTAVDVAVRSHFVNREGEFDAIAEFRVDFEKDGAQEITGSIAATYVVTYSTEKPMTDRIWRVFSERNLRMNLWPYLREFVDSATVRMAWPRLILPTMNSARALKPATAEDKADTE